MNEKDTACPIQAAHDAGTEADGGWRMAGQQSLGGIIAVESKLVLHAAPRTVAQD